MSANDYDGWCPVVEVYESGKKETPIVVYDAEGNPLMKRVDKVKLGFDLTVKVE